MADYQIKGNPSAGLWGATLGFFIGFAAVSLFGPTVKFFETVIGLSPALAGLLISIPNLSGSLLRIPFSAWVDTTGGRKPFLVLLVFSVIGLIGLNIVLFQDQSRYKDLFPLILLFGILGGCGVATFSVGISQTSYWFPQKQQGGALGTYAGLGNVAPGLFAFLLTGFALPAFGLAGSYLAWLVFLVIGTLIYFFIGKNAPFFQLLQQGIDREKARNIASKGYGQELFPKENLKRSLIVSAKVWKTWLLVVIYFTTFGGFMALTGWFPKYWLSFYGSTLQTAGIMTTVYSILASLIRVGGGKVSDKLGGENTAFLSLLTLLAGSLIMTFSFNFSLSVTGVILMALGMGVTNAAVFKLVPQEVPKAVGGTAGWVGGLGAFGGFVFPNAMASFIGEKAVGDPGYAVGFLVFVVFAIISLIIVLILKATSR